MEDPALCHYIAIVSIKRAKGNRTRAEYINAMEWQP
jgi:hypothetical protein